MIDHVCAPPAPTWKSLTRLTLTRRLCRCIGARPRLPGRERLPGLLVLPDPLFLTERRRIAEALKARLPTAFARSENVEAGGLISYGPKLTELFRRAASYVDKILKGAKPADLPVDQPTKFELVINLKTAKALGLTIPQSLLLRADQIIE